MTFVLIGRPLPFLTVLNENLYLHGGEVRPTGCPADFTIRVSCGFLVHRRSRTVTTLAEVCVGHIALVYRIIW